MEENNVTSNEAAGTIKRIPRTRREAKPKKVQIAQAVVCLVAVTALGLYLSQGNVRLGLFWMFGILFGIVLQRSRFCFTAAFRDPWLTGSTSLTDRKSVV